MSLPIPSTSILDATVPPCPPLGRRAGERPAPELPSDRVAGDPVRSGGSPESSLDGSSEGPPPVPARAGLLLGSPRQVLARIQRGDPLGLRPRAARAVARRGVLVDPDRLHLRVLAGVARAAGRRGGLHSLEAFLEERVTDALDDLLHDEAEAVRRGEAPDPLSVVTTLARGLELDPRSLRAVQARFNRRPPSERRALTRILIEARDPERVAREEGVTLVEVSRRARRAALAVLGPELRGTATPGAEDGGPR